MAQLVINPETGEVRGVTQEQYKALPDVWKQTSPTIEQLAEAFPGPQGTISYPEGIAEGATGVVKSVALKNIPLTPEGGLDVEKAIETWGPEVATELLAKRAAEPEKIPEAVSGHVAYKEATSAIEPYKVDGGYNIISAMEAEVPEDVLKRVFTEDQIKSAGQQYEEFKIRRAEAEKQEAIAEEYPSYRINGTIVTSSAIMAGIAPSYKEALAQAEKERKQVEIAKEFPGYKLGETIVTPSAIIADVAPQLTDIEAAQAKYKTWGEIEKAVESGELSRTTAEFVFGPVPSKSDVILTSPVPIQDQKNLVTDPITGSTYDAKWYEQPMYEGGPTFVEQVQEGSGALVEDSEQALKLMFDTGGVENVIQHFKGIEDIKLEEALRPAATEIMKESGASYEDSLAAAKLIYETGGTEGIKEHFEGVQATKLEELKPYAVKPREKDIEEYLETGIAPGAIVGYNIAELAQGLMVDTGDLALVEAKLKSYGFEDDVIKESIRALKEASEAPSISQEVDLEEIFLSESPGDQAKIIGTGPGFYKLGEPEYKTDEFGIKGWVGSTEKVPKTYDELSPERQEQVMAHYAVIKGLAPGLGRQIGEHLPITGTIFTIKDRGLLSGWTWAQIGADTALTLSLVGKAVDIPLRTMVSSFTKQAIVQPAARGAKFTAEVAKAYPELTGFKQLTNESIEALKYIKGLSGEAGSRIATPFGETLAGELVSGARIAKTEIAKALELARAQMKILQSEYVVNLLKYDRSTLALGSPRYNTIVSELAKSGAKLQEAAKHYAQLIRDNTEFYIPKSLTGPQRASTMSFSDEVLNIKDKTKDAVKLVMSKTTPVDKAVATEAGVRTIYGIGPARKATEVAAELLTPYGTVKLISQQGLFSPWVGVSILGDILIASMFARPLLSKLALKPGYIKDLVNSVKAENKAIASDYKNLSEPIRNALDNVNSSKLALVKHEGRLYELEDAVEKLKKLGGVSRTEDEIELALRSAIDDATGVRHYMRDLKTKGLSGLISGLERELDALKVNHTAYEVLDNNYGKLVSLLKDDVTPKLASGGPKDLYSIALASVERQGTSISKDVVSQVKTFLREPGKPKVNIEDLRVELSNINSEIGRIKASSPTTNIDDLLARSRELDRLISEGNPTYKMQSLYDELVYIDDELTSLRGANKGDSIEALFLESRRTKVHGDLLEEMRIYLKPGEELKGSGGFTRERPEVGKPLPGGSGGTATKVVEMEESGLGLIPRAADGTPLFDPRLWALGIMVKYKVPVKRPVEIYVTPSDPFAPWTAPPLPGQEPPTSLVMPTILPPTIAPPMIPTIDPFTIPIIVPSIPEPSPGKVRYIKVTFWLEQREGTGQVTSIPVEVELPETRGDFVSSLPKVLTITGLEPADISILSSPEGEQALSATFSDAVQKSAEAITEGISNVELSNTTRLSLQDAVMSVINLKPTIEPEFKVSWVQGLASPIPEEIGVPIEITVPEAAEAPEALGIPAEIPTDIPVVSPVAVEVPVVAPTPVAVPAPVTVTMPAVLPETALVPELEIKVPPGIETPPKGPPIEPPGKVPPIIPPGDEDKERVSSTTKLPGITFRQGLIWIVVMPPYTQANVSSTDEPPLGTYVVDRGKPRETIMAMNEGMEPPDVNFAITWGMFDIEYNNGELIYHSRPSAIHRKGIVQEVGEDLFEEEETSNVPALTHVEQTVMRPTL